RADRGLEGGGGGDGGHDVALVVACRGGHAYSSAHRAAGKLGNRATRFAQAESVRGLVAPEPRLDLVRARSMMSASDGCVRRMRSSAPCSSASSLDAGRVAGAGPRRLERRRLREDVAGMAKLDGAAGYCRCARAPRGAATAPVIGPVAGSELRSGWLRAEQSGEDHMQVVRGGRGEQAGSTQLRQGAQASLEHTGGPGQFIRCQLGGDCGCVALGAIVYPAARDVRQGSQKGGERRRRLRGVHGGSSVLRWPQGTRRTGQCALQPATDRCLQLIAGRRPCTASRVGSRRWKVSRACGQKPPARSRTSWSQGKGPTWCWTAGPLSVRSMSTIQGAMSCGHWTRKALSS